MTLRDVIQWLCYEIDKQVTRKYLVIAYLKGDDYFPAFGFNYGKNAADLQCIVY